MAAAATAPAAIGGFMDFSDAKDFVPYEGLGDSSLLPFDGYVGAKITKAIVDKSASGNGTYTIVMVVEDEEPFNGEEVNGSLLMKSVPFNGVRKDGKQNSNSVLEILASHGVTREDIQKAGFAGKKDVSPEKFAEKYLIGKHVHVRVQRNEFTRKNGDAGTNSSVEGFVLPAFYAERKAMGGTSLRHAHRGAAPSQTPATPANRGTNGAAGHQAAAAPAPTDTPAAATGASFDEI